MNFGVVPESLCNNLYCFPIAHFRVKVSMQLYAPTPTQGLHDGVDEAAVQYNIYAWAASDSNFTFI